MNINFSRNVTLPKGNSFKMDIDEPQLAYLAPRKVYQTKPVCSRDSCKS